MGYIYIIVSENNSLKSKNQGRWDDSQNVRQSRGIIVSLKSTACP